MNNISRRKLIKNLALGGAALFHSPAILSLSGCSAKDRLGVALVGLGYYSTDLLAPALQQTTDCYLAGIVTGTPAKAIAWRQQAKQMDDDSLSIMQNKLPRGRADEVLKE